MRFWPRVKNDFGPIPQPDPEQRAIAEEALRPNVAGTGDGGRLTTDNAFTFFGTPNVILPPRDPEDQWKLFHLDSETLERMSPARLMEMLADLSPDVSRALWDFLRFCNPGFELTVVGPDGKTPDARGTAAARTFLTTLSNLYGSVDVVFGRLFIGAFLRGALFAEIVLDEAGRMPVDFATPDSASVRFRQQDDPVRGRIWQLGQIQNVITAVAGFVPLDRPTIRYIPIDPFPGNPYGRAMAAPALFSAMFLLGLLHDLRRVVAQQGYPRLDIEIDLVALLESAPDDVKENDAKTKAWIDATIKEVEDRYNCLQPDSAFVHTSPIKLNRPVGTIDSSSLGAVDGLIEAIERMLVRALKTMPFMMASNQSATETQANRQWEVQVAGIKAIQHYAETLFSGLMTLGLQAQGIAATATLRFAELRAAEMLRDAQTEAAVIQNAFNQYANGWISQDHAALRGAGQAKADATAPRILPRGATETTDATAAQLAPESGSSRGVRLVSGQRVAKQKVTISGKTHATDIERVNGALDDWPEEEQDRLWNAVS